MTLAFEAESSKSIVHHWLDVSAGLAYIAVSVHLKAFRQFLDAVDKLIANPAWQPGTPVLEDLRDCVWIPPPTALEEWRAYLAERHSMVTGCRWAVVLGPHNPTVSSILDSAAEDAARAGVLLKQFTSTIDAHLWLKGAPRVCISKAGISQGSFRLEIR